ncbi:sigma-70 family RNA polymerase sigma factor [Herbidospora sp. NEAU-GS84]|uniref:Sigma-70 family RNA polymerase sigma factor n=1 Tax=Herbidospora solisilvae TaxID=2696284 RepID=A0A7C9J1A1_9ACTN|nr:sigma-70 family RNA polymerase sigma factor [Herbidospora solisilvae]NAS21626.1 sigma-70 family RNA polymerase sigma factor [Herbidospora solisilvae]
MPEHVARFTRLFDDCYEPVLRYAARRVGGDSAGDVAAETFVVAWRKIADLPARDDEALPWLYGIARNLVANEQRRERRSRRLMSRLMSVSWAGRDTAGDHADDAVAASGLEQALRRLSPQDQEVLRLIGWEDLSISHAALVLGCTPATMAVRAQRARRRFLAALDDLQVRPEASAKERRS